MDYIKLLLLRSQPSSKYIPPPILAAFSIRIDLLILKSEGSTYKCRPPPKDAALLLIILQYLIYRFVLYAVIPTPWLPLLKRKFEFLIETFYLR